MNMNIVIAAGMAGLALLALSAPAADAPASTAFSTVGRVEFSQGPTGTDLGGALQLLGSLPPGLLKTLTFDNGKEFAKFHVLVEREAFERLVKQALEAEVA